MNWISGNGETSSRRRPLALFLPEAVQTTGTVEDVASRFYLALGVTREEVNDFGNAALSTDRKSKAS
jgi:hypothetical protein